MHQPIPVGHATKVGTIVAIVGLVPGLITQVVALVENTTAHWSSPEKIAFISSAVVAVATMAGRFAQAVAAILKGS